MQIFLLTYWIWKNIFTKQPIDRLTINIVEILKVSSIEWSVDKWMYKSNPRNTNFGYLSFGGD